ncbi:MAG: hypothetical protein PHN66_02600 [Candidatus Shapirobacteria bacterium]|nr:hypothetical protein [Candidatus Shapirobacteria bacterium]
MIQTDQRSFAHVRKIDNSKQRLPVITLFFLIFLVIVLIWFFKGGSFRFYASLFFGLYFLTKSTWISIILVGVIQTIIFLPFRIINENLKPDLKEFEKELEKTKGEKQQILLTKQIKSGSWSVVFHTLNFILLALAFFSVGRIFFMDFYHHPIDASKFLYDFIPYPQYPLQGTIFKFPWIHVLKTTALSWQTIFTIWGVLLGFFVVLRFLWLFLRRFLSKNKSILNIRIQYNNLLIFISSFIGTLFLISLFVFRHIPTAGEIIILSADLTKQNTGFNIITAICTFIATISSGIKSNRELSAEARINNIPEETIQKVTRQHLKKSAQNGLLLSLFTIWVTRLMPCSHDLSVLSFEFIYFISPLTFDRFVKKTSKSNRVELPVEKIS